MAVEIKGWEASEMALYQSSYAKSEGIRQFLDEKMAELFLSSTLRSLLPENFSTYYSRKFEKAETPLSWVENEVTKHLKKEGEIEFGLEFIRKIPRAIEVCVCSKEKHSPNEYRITVDLLRNNIEFLRKRREKCLDAAVFQALTGEGFLTRANAEEKFEAHCKFIVDILKTYEETYLEDTQKSIEGHDSFLSPADKIVLMAAKSLIKPNLVTNTPNHPLAIGLAFRSNQIKNLEHQFQQAMFASDEQKSEMEEVVDTAMQLESHYQKAQDDHGRYEVALEIINQAGEMWPVSTPLQLRTLFLLSTQGKETPSFFKTQLMTLCKQIKEFKREKPKEPTRGDGDCVVM